MGFLAGGYHSKGSGGGDGAVTLSGEFVSSVWTDEVGIRFNSDGTIDSKIGATYAQVDAGTDWIIPNGDAPGLYEIMTDNWNDIGGDTKGFENAAAAEGVWIALTSNREWTVKGTASGGADSNIMQFDAHIRHNASQPLASGAYEIESELE